MSDNLDGLINKLDTLANNAKELDGTHKIPATELFGKAFLSQHTNNHFAFDYFSILGKCISYLQEFVSAGNFSEALFEDIPQKDLDHWVSQATDFNSWDEMLSAAGEEYVVRKLGF